MTGKLLARATAVLLALTLAACGGGDDSTPLAGGGSGGSGGGDGGETPVEIGSVRLLTSQPQIGSSGANSATVTAVVLDRNSVVVEGRTVNFSVEGDAALTILTQQTDGEGRAQARVTAGTNPVNRTIRVTAAAGSEADTVDIQVTGTSLSLTGSTSIALNDTASFTARLTDSDGSGIQGVPLTPSSSLGNSISSSTLTTDSAGLVRFTLSATQGGAEVVSVQAYSGAGLVAAQQETQISTDSFQFTLPEPGQEVELNESEIVRVAWANESGPVADGTQVQFSTTRGTLSPVNGLVTTTGGVAEVAITSNNVGPATITAQGADGGPSSQRTLEFVSSTPSSISVQADRTQIGINSSTTITATVRDVNDNLVKNALVRFELQDITGGSISDGSVTTNSQGRAQTTYTSSSTTSSSGGVVVSAIISDTIIDSVALTVGGDALRINIGTGNEVDDNDLTRYRAPWTVFVTDSNGNAVSGKTVNISVVPTRFYKGEYVEVIGGTPRFQAQRIEPACASEDVDNNGLYTVAKDINSNGRLDPIPSATVPGTITTLADGTADFTLTYPKSECNWVEVQLSASTSVGGTESRASQRFTLACTTDDLNEAPPGGRYSPYGSQPGCDNDD